MNGDWRMYVIAVLAGLVAGGVIPTSIPNVVRPDPFTGADAEKMEKRITQLLDKHIKHIDDLEDRLLNDVEKHIELHTLRGHPRSLERATEPYP
jgi:hypothetical protein